MSIASYSTKQLFEVESMILTCETITKPRGTCLGTDVSVSHRPVALLTYEPTGEACETLFDEAFRESTYREYTASPAQVGSAADTPRSPCEGFRLAKVLKDPDMNTNIEAVAGHFCRGFDVKFDCGMIRTIDRIDCVVKPTAGTTFTGEQELVRAVLAQRCIMRDGDFKALVKRPDIVFKLSVLTKAGLVGVALEGGWPKEIEGGGQEGCQE